MTYISKLRIYAKIRTFCFKVQLRETAKSFDEKVVELQTSKRQAEEMLEDVQARFKELETSSRTETELLQNQVGGLINFFVQA